MILKQQGTNVYIIYTSYTGGLKFRPFRSIIASFHFPLATMLHFNI